MLNSLVDEWFSLLAYCNDRQNFDQKTFKMKQENITYKYKRLDYSGQGEFTHLISEALKVLPTASSE